MLQMFVEGANYIEAEGKVSGYNARTGNHENRGCGGQHTDHKNETRMEQMAGLEMPQAGATLKSSWHFNSS